MLLWLLQTLPDIGSKVLAKNPLNVLQLLAVGSDRLLAMNRFPKVVSWKHRSAADAPATPVSDNISAMRRALDSIRIRMLCSFMSVVDLSSGTYVDDKAAGSADFRTQSGYYAICGEGLYDLGHHFPEQLQAFSHHLLWGHQGPGFDAVVLTPHTPWDPNANERAIEAARQHRIGSPSSATSRLTSSGAARS